MRKWALDRNYGRTQKLTGRFNTDVNTRTYIYNTSTCNYKFTIHSPPPTCCGGESIDAGVRRSFEGTLLVHWCEYRRLGVDPLNALESLETDFADGVMMIRLALQYDIVL